MSSRAQEPKSPRAQELMCRRAKKPKTPRAHEPMGPRTCYIRHPLKLISLNVCKCKNMYVRANVNALRVYTQVTQSFVTFRLLSIACKAFFISLEHSLVQSFKQNCPICICNNQLDGKEKGFSFAIDTKALRAMQC